MTTIISVGGMTCQHCVKAVSEAVAAVPGVSSVGVDLPAGRVMVEGRADDGDLRAAIQAAGYTIE